METAPADTRRISRRDFIRGSALILSGAAIVNSRCEPGPTAAASGGKPVLKIGLLTDIHYADKPEAIGRFYKESAGKVREAVDYFNETGINFAVELGDLIDAAESVELELAYLKKIEQEYARIKGQRHYVFGNHCLWTVSKKEFLENTGALNEFYSFDQGGFHFVILDACYRADGVPYHNKNFEWTDTEIPERERAWLEEDLRKASAPVIIFVHQRLDVANNYAVKSAPAIRALLEKSGKVRVVFQGHSHKNDYREINGIHYCTLAALVEGSGLQNGGYAALSLYKDGSLKVDGFRKQKSYALKAP